MKNYLVMIRFVILLTLFTSFIFIGMEVWTRPLIEANSTAEFKSTILSAYNLSFTTPTINQVFESEIEIVESDGLTFYVDKKTGKVSYEISGPGVWGPIIGIITLEPDFKTIYRIRITQQEETPGLGGVVASIPYLTKYEGISFSNQNPYIIIAKPQDQKDLSNEVDSITGATRTSNAFQTILNESYAAHAVAWRKVGR
jgi:Na+-transporting NADH:ubiquinone oxidoreductase subunit C